MESKFHDALAMAKTSRKSMLPENVSEFAVTRDKLLQFFDPPIGKSTFHDLVNRGSIISLKGLRGYYCLNESLVRMGLKPVEKLPRNEDPSLEDLMRFAFWVIEPDLFLFPLRFSDRFPSLTAAEGRYVLSLIESQQVQLESFDAPELKIAYAGGFIEGSLQGYSKDV